MTSRHETYAESPAPAEDRDGIDNAIRMDLPSDDLGRSEQACLFRFTWFLGWVIAIAGIALGGWLSWRSRENPSAMRVLGAVLVALTGILWGRAAHSVSRSGRKVIHDSSPPAPQA